MNINEKIPGIMPTDVGHPGICGFIEEISGLRPFFSILINGLHGGRI
jgi:hypothetical protein